MTLRTITFDDEQWQVVPKILAPVMWHAMLAAPTEALAWSCALAAAPEPPAQPEVPMRDLLAEEQAEELAEQLAVTVRVGKQSVTRVAVLYSSQQRRGRGVEDALDGLFEMAMHELIDDEVI